jgi:hypothetical protein
MGLPGKGGLGTEGVEVKMKWNRGNRLLGGVAIFEDFRRVQRLGIDVDTGIDPIGHDPL